MTLRLADHCARELVRMADADPRIWVLDGDLADSDGAAFFARRRPNRFLAAGIAEQSMVSLAAGMASCGRRPWVFSFAAFLTARAYDQVRVCVSQAAQPVTLVGSHSGGCANRNGKTHAATTDVALMASLPSIGVWAPAGPTDLRFAMKEIMGTELPAYIRLPRRPLRNLPGKAAVCRRLGLRQRVALVGTGFGTHLALGAAAVLRGWGLPVSIVHCARLKPLPVDRIADELEGVDQAFVVEDHSTFGGLGSLLQGAGLEAEISSFGWPPDWSGQSGTDEELLESHGLDSVGLARAIATRVHERRLGPVAQLGLTSQVECSPPS